MLPILDDSTVLLRNDTPVHGFHGFEIELRRIEGARSVRVVHPGAQGIENHAHDWACLTLHVVGRAEEVFEDGELLLDGPSAVYHPPGAVHSDAIGSEGFESISIQFDPLWLATDDFRLETDRSLSWRGGLAGSAARWLANLWSNADCPAPALAEGTRQFFVLAAQAEAPPEPAWLSAIKADIGRRPDQVTRRLAAGRDLSAVWLARAYRSAVGEGIQETLRRTKVETAMALLRGTDQSLVEIAEVAGFCDQSHMNRSFRLLLGRTPRQVRSEREDLLLAGVATGCSASP